MSTDFSYGGKQIVISGPIKPNGKDMPSDARTRVESYADIASIPNPHVGLKITVKVDETNNNKMTDYIVKSLKANSMGVANSLIDEVVRYVDYLGANGQGVDTNNFATKEELGLKADKTELHSHINKTVLDGITSTNVDNWNNKVDKVEGKTLTTNDYTNEEKQTVASLKATVGDTSSGLVKDVKDLKTNGVSQDNINVAIENYLQEHPVSGGATAEQVAQIEANRTAIGDENSGLVKEVNNIKNTELQNLNTAILRVNETVGNKSELPVGDENIIASINRIDGKTTTGNGLTSEQAQRLQTAYEHSQSDHVTMDEVNAAISNAQLGGGEVDTTSFATDLSLVGSNLQLKNSNGALIGSSVILPSSTGGTAATNEVNFSVSSKLGKIVQKIYSDRPNCIVSFISDDLYMADYTKRDWFKELGCAYTIPVVCSRINSEGYPTLEQVLELQNDYGYEIASHTFNHVELDKQTDEVMEREIKSSFEFLNKNGLRCENFMIPYGKYNNKVLAVASKYYRSTRSSEEDYNSIGLDTTHIKSFWIDQYKTTDLEGQKARVDNAFENGLWLIFSMHTGMMQSSEFTDMVKPLIEYINSKNIPIMTVSKALDYFQNPIEVSSITSAGVRTRHFYINAKGEIKSDEISLLSNKVLEQENTIKVLTSKQNDIISRLTALEQNEGGAIPVQSVSINNTPITVQINKSKKLTCTVLPSTATDKTVVWSGDNDTIATITSDGTITGNQLGTVNITVTTNDGNKTDTVSVEVVETHVSSENFRTLTLDGSETWSEDTSFTNHGSTYDTSVFRTPTPTWCDGTAINFSKYSRDFKEVNFKVVPGLSTRDMYSTYHDNAIIVRDDYIYVEIKNSLLSTTGVNGFKNYLNSNNISVDIRTKVYNKKYITIDGYSGLSILNFTNISNGVFHAYLTIDKSLTNFGVTTSISEQLNWIDYDNRNFDKTVKDIFTYNSSNLFIGIDANKLSEFTIEALNQYLNVNPIVIELTLS